VSVYALEMDHRGSAPGEGVSLGIKKGAFLSALTASEDEAERLTGLLTGLIPTKKDELLLDGGAVRFRSPRDALNHGVGAVYRRGGLAGSMTLLRHLRLVSGLRGGRKRLLAEAQALAERWSIQTEWDIPASEMLSGDRFRGELLLLLLEDADILILEGPENRLTSLEMEELAALCRRLVKAGKSVLLVTSREETAALADEIKALGGNREEGRLPKLNRLDIAPGSVTLEARNVTLEGKKRGESVLRAVSLEARAGEITAVAGMPGSGIPYLAEAIAGIRPLTHGRIRLNGKEITALSPRERMRQGMAFAPGGKNFGFLPGASPAESMALRRYGEARFQELGFLKKGEMGRFADALVDWSEYPDAQDMDDLSPAQRQICALRRDMSQNPEILVALNPTAGMNAREAREIHQMLMSFRKSRRAVLILTEDIPEAYEIGDRIVVLRQGETVGEFEPGLTTLREIGLYMTGERFQGREEPFDEE